jgi:hypothetical protein
MRRRLAKARDSRMDVIRQESRNRPKTHARSWRVEHPASAWLKPGPYITGAGVGAPTAVGAAQVMRWGMKSVTAWPSFMW